MPMTRRDSFRLLAQASVATGVLCLHDPAPAGTREPKAGAGKPGTTLSAGRLEAASRYSAERRGYALWVKQHGQVIHESYANGASRGQPRRIYSGTKAFWGLAAMAAVEDGLVRLEDRVADTLRDWQADARKARVTVEQLLDFSGGLERCLALHQDGLSNRNAQAMARPMVAEPGKAFIYGPSQLQVFHELLKRKLAAAGGKHPETPTRYLERRVLRPLGLGPQRYLPDRSGNPLLAAGFMMSAAQWARMGDVLLAGGAPVLKPGSLQAAIEGSAANASYSFGIWNNRAVLKSNPREFDIEDMLEEDWYKQSWARACICQDAPSDLLACIGSGYQRLFVIPSQGLVVVRQGVNARFSDGDFLRTLLGVG